MLDTNCAQASIFNRITSDTERLLDMDHIAICPECSRLLEGHQKLEFAFKATPRSSPSIHFYRELKNRLADERQYERQVRRRAVVLRAYWLFATVVSLAVLWLVPWPEQSVPGPLLPSIVIFLMLVAIVPTMLYRSLRSDRSLL